MSIEIESIQRIDLKPGEALALKFDHDLSQDEALQVRETLRNLGLGVPMIVLGPHMEVFAISAEERAELLA